MNRLLGLVCLLAVAGVACAGPGRDAIVGFWRVAGGGAVFRVERAGGHYRGRLVWLREAVGDRGAGADARIPPDDTDTQPGGRSLLGAPLLTGLTYHSEDGDAQWRGGHIYNTDNGKRYRCYVWLADADHLKLRGYIGLAVFGKTTTWRRVVDPRRAQTDGAHDIGAGDPTANNRARRRVGPF